MKANVLEMSKNILLESIEVCAFVVSITNIEKSFEFYFKMGSI